MRYSVNSFLNALNLIQYKVEYVEVIENNFFSMKFIVTTKSHKEYLITLLCDCYNGVDKAFYTHMSVYNGSSAKADLLLFDPNTGPCIKISDIVFLNKLFSLLEIDCKKSKTSDNNFFRFDFVIKDNTYSICFKKDLNTSNYEQFICKVLKNDEIV